ncbi:MAG: hypothetical protein H0T73_22965 [Ardenticatenales bacterium]|nr:hypothetical protein [Ardenticatenales bacterium]
MSNPILWFIDEDDIERETYYKELRRLLPISIQIETISPLPQTVEGFLDLLINPYTACIIVDQRLNEGGDVNYNGITIAKYLRGVNSKIPIYILTNYAKNHDEFAGGEWSVEEVIAKGDLQDDRLSAIITARLLRRISVYEDILIDREQRFNELLKKSLIDSLDDNERTELNELRFARVAPILADELTEVTSLEESIDINKKLLSLLEKYLPEIGVNNE